MSFHVGQHVVHVTPKRSRLSIKNRPADAQMPELGRVYTIRDISDFGDVQLVRLVELNNRHLMERLGSEKEPGFNTSGFRPLDESRLDIFRAHLAPSPKQKERA